MEGAALGLFMLSAGFFTTLLENPGSAVRGWIGDAFTRRIIMGAAMGLTAVGIIYSPWGRQSGAHMNPAVTLTYYRLGKVRGWDAFFYALFQFTGGTAGILLASLLLGHAITVPEVNYAVTVPGNEGSRGAFISELAISFILMSVILRSTSDPRLGRWTGVFAGVLIALYITFESPLSGMSMNPARTFASAVPARVWTAFWVYCTAPPLGMLLAGEIHRAKKFCAKLHHHNNKRCIFCGSMREE